MTRGFRFAALLLYSWLTIGCSRPPVEPAARGPASAAASAQPQADQIWRNRVPPAGTAGQLAYPPAEVHALHNGLQVLLVPQRSGVVAISVVTQDGASSLPVGKSGLAALTTRMLTEGSRQHSWLEIAEAAESLGSVLDSDAARDYCRVGLLVLRSDVEAGLALLGEVVREPAFSEAEFERVRGEWLDSLRAERQQPLRLASLAGLRLLLGAPHGAPVRGSVPDVRALTTRDLRAFHRRVFTPPRAALVVAGQVSWHEVEPLIERHFGAWRDSATHLDPPPVRLTPPKQTQIALVDRPGAVQSALFVAQLFPPRGAPGHEARQLLSSLLGELFTSRLNANLREKHGFTYGAHSRAIATRYWGAFVVTTMAATNVTAAALEQIELELEYAKAPGRGHPITLEEVQRARADAIYSLGAHLQSVTMLGLDATDLFSYGLEPTYYAGFPERVAALTPAEVQAEATRGLNPIGLQVVVVGDRSEIEAELRRDGVTVETAPPALLE
jgi:zinc protease